MKHGDPDAPEPVLRAEHQHAQQRAHALHHHGAGKDLAQEAEQAGQIVQVEGALQQQAVLQGDLPADQHHDAGGERDHTQPAQLDQQQNDNFPEQAPVGKGVHHGQTRHTHRGGRGKQGVQVGRHLPGSRSDGQRQEYTAHQHRRKKAQNN